MAETLEVYDVMKLGDPQHLDNPEREISKNMQDILLGNEQTAHLTYNIIEDSDGSGAYTITLGHAVNGSKIDISFEGGDGAVGEVNRYIFTKAIAMENPTTLDPEVMGGYDSTSIALLQEDINQALMSLSK